MLDRAAASTTLAKAIAYLACGKRAEASQWARELIAMLRGAGLDV